MEFIISVSMQFLYPPQRQVRSGMYFFLKYIYIYSCYLKIEDFNEVVIF